MSATKVMWPGVCVSGDARAGKDTLADLLISEFGFEGDSLARDLKRIAKNEFGWDGAKDARGRKLLQILGTEAGRGYNLDLWIARLEGRHPARFDPDHRGSPLTLIKPLVVPDVRFPNELEFFRKHGFLTVKVERPSLQGKEAFRAHASERSLAEEQFDLVIVNEGTLEEYQQHIRNVIRPILEAGRGIFLEPGKCYRMRGGHKVRVYAVDGQGVLPVHGAWQDVHGGWRAGIWTRFGAWNAGEETDRDIVGVWQDRPNNDTDVEPLWRREAPQGEQDAD